LDRSGRTQKIQGYIGCFFLPSEKRSPSGGISFWREAHITMVGGATVWGAVVCVKNVISKGRLGGGGLWKVIGVDGVIRMGSPQ
jgi:hypothetical protein